MGGRFAGRLVGVISLLAARLHPARGRAKLGTELEILNRLGLSLAGQLDMESLVAAVTDAGVMARASTGRRRRRARRPRRQPG